MTSKRTAQQKRAKQPRNSDRAKTFTKDWERLSHSGRFDLVRLKHAMLLLIANEGALPAEFNDHPLKGKWVDYRECHIGGDFLLVYQLRGDDEVIFVRTGTHADIFEQ